MVSDEDLQTLIQTLVLHHHAPVADPSLLVHQLEAKLGLDLTHKAAFIRDHAAALLVGFGFQRQGFEGSPFAHLPGRSELGFESGRVEGEEKGGGSSGSAKGRVAQPGAKKRGGPGGLNKVCGVSPELQAIVGESTMARTQIVKQLWVYIRKNNLQDPNNKRKIICNDELRLVFETDSTDMFKMNKLLAKHIIPLEASKDAGPDSKRLKTTEAVPEPEPVPVPVPVPMHEGMLQHDKVAQHVLSMLDHDTVLGHGLLPEHDAVGNYPIVLSDALAEFFGTGERQMLQSEAMKRIWDYIKANKLQGPADSMMIQFDSKLARLFGCDSLSVLGISEMLSCHMIKQS